MKSEQAVLPNPCLEEEEKIVLLGTGIFCGIIIAYASIYGL
jgi:hypothetical protein